MAVYQAWQADQARAFDYPGAIGQRDISLEVFFSPGKNDLAF